LLSQFSVVLRGYTILIKIGQLGTLRSILFTLNSTIGKTPQK